jgi:hypothetical protein
MPDDQCLPHAFACSTLAELTRARSPAPHPKVTEERFQNDQFGLRLSWPRKARLAHRTKPTDASSPASSVAERDIGWRSILQAASTRRTRPRTP